MAIIQVCLLNIVALLQRICNPCLATLRGGAGAWLRVFAINLAGSAGVTGISIRSSGSAAPWQPLVNKFGASFESYSQPSQPSDLQITTDDGQSIILQSVITAGATGIVDSGVQLSTTPSQWDPSIQTTTFNPAVQPGSTSTAVISVPFGTKVESASCDFTTLDVNFAGATYSCAQQKAFGKCNSTFLNRPIKQQDLTVEGMDPGLHYCHSTCANER